MEKHELGSEESAGDWKMPSEGKQRALVRMMEYAEAFREYTQLNSLSDAAVPVAAAVAVVAGGLMMSVMGSVCTLG